MQQYDETGVIDPILVDLSVKRKIETVTSLIDDLDLSAAAAATPPPIEINAPELGKAIEKLRQHLFTIVPEDYDKIREMCTILDIPWFIAPTEAETMCADLTLQRHTAFALSEDTDLLAYGSDLLCKLDMKSETCQLVRYEKVLEQLGMTPDQFLDFCIMCGCDYNSNIPKVGIVNSYKLITEHGSIEEIDAKTKHDITFLNHERCRELFRNYPKVDEQFTVPFCGEPKWKKLEVFVFQNGIRVSIQDIKKHFIETKIKFE